MSEFYDTYPEIEIQTEGHRGGYLVRLIRYDDAEEIFDTSEEKYIYVSRLAIDAALQKIVQEALWRGEDAPEDVKFR